MQGAVHRIGGLSYTCSREKAAPAGEMAYAGAQTRGARYMIHGSCTLAYFAYSLRHHSAEPTEMC